ncbi:trypsin-like peptidase domain-containing protein [Actinoplanes sp. NPDC051861]|uniref:trypsin-like peptidase domain-containing protein n=1 Tax=Actinoplanes sp. NPDC051861 TaxID=3155170 RepID=UPI0034463AB2
MQPLPTVNSRQLPQFVIRVDDPAGGVLGTGFFFAPGRALTCAHVVGGRDTVRVVPHRGASLEAEVEFSSAPPGPERDLWPFPDVAVLRLRDPIEHAWVRLHDRPEEDPASDVDLHAWGYPRRGRESPGSPASFRFEGVDGDGFLRLKGGQVAPGLSGAPLLCPRRRAVVGVVKATRDPHSDLGGLATPVAMWLQGADMPHDSGSAQWEQVFGAAAPDPVTMPVDDDRPFPDGYLTGLTAADAAALRKVNRAGLAALRRYLRTGNLVAVLGPRTAMPLYPARRQTVADLVEGAVEHGLDEQAAAECRAFVESARPDQAIARVRELLDLDSYQAVVREAMRPRRNPDTGRTWTPIQELICRWALRGVLTTTFDPGIVDARMRVRPYASGTGFTSWIDDAGLRRWSKGRVFEDVELPVLYGNGHHNQPDSLLLVESDLKNVYGGRLAPVLRRLIDDEHVVWLGFDHSDGHLTTMLKAAAESTGVYPGADGEARHVAVLPWDPGTGRDLQMLRRLAATQFGADLVIYPVRGEDHGALEILLEALADPGLPAAAALPSPAPARPATVPALWEHGAQPAQRFVGRTEELARLDRWAADPQVRMVAVNAWGGAGKTALVTHWLSDAGGLGRRAGAVAMFGWSFYTDPSAEQWAARLLAWAHATFSAPPPPEAPEEIAGALVRLLHQVPVILVLDGLEVVQEGPDSGGYGRLLDGLLREVLTAACRRRHASLIVLTSRFPFADLQRFDGSGLRVLDVPPFTPAEGASLLAEAAPGVFTDAGLRDLVAHVDGHALAVAVMASLLATQPDADTAAELRSRLATTTRTRQKIGRVLTFYAERLTSPQGHLAGIVALFTRPVTAEQILAVAHHRDLARLFEGWDSMRIRAAVRGPLAGLLSEHPDGTISAHPLIRDTFRPLVFGAAGVAADVTLAGLPSSVLTSRDEALRVAEAIELSLDAGQWRAAEDLYRRRTRNGQVWFNLPAAWLGQRVATAFVATAVRRDDCRKALSSRHLVFFVNEAGLLAMTAGDMTAAVTHLSDSIKLLRNSTQQLGLSRVLGNLARCLGQQGHLLIASHTAAEALEVATGTSDSAELWVAHSRVAWVSGLAGDTAIADTHVRKAAGLMPGRRGALLYGISGVWWGEHLTRTGRTAAARTLTEANLSVCRQHGLHSDAARCRAILAALDLRAGDVVRAATHVNAALATLRAGDNLPDLAGALVLAAERDRVSGDLDTADIHAAEAIDAAAPRDLVITHAAGLTVQARIAADRFIATGDEEDLNRARDAAEAAHRMATGPEPLPWAELDAAQVLARLDGADTTWSERARQLRSDLIPAGLEANPLEG